MYHDLRRKFWWRGMQKDVALFVSRCLTCQQVKVEHQRPAGPLQPLKIAEWKWDFIAMDFVRGLPKSQQGKDGVWVIIDRLTLCNLYIREIVRLHGIPLSIVSDRDPLFTSKFLDSFQQAMGTNVDMSTSFHPQTDGQSERTIQILEDMLRACAIDFKGNWSEQLPLMEFAYNNSYQSSIGMALYEALYGRPCRTPFCWAEVSERSVLGPEVIQETTSKIKIIQERLKTAQSRKKSYADSKRRLLEFQVGGNFFLKVSPRPDIKRFGKKSKLSPRYIGPFEILERVGEVAYRLALPPQLADVRNVFHVSMLRRYNADPSHVIERRDLQLNDDIGYVEKPLRIAGTREHVLRMKSIKMVKVLWQHHTLEEATWELDSDVRDKYPELLEEYERSLQQ